MIVGGQDESFSTLPFRERRVGTKQKRLLRGFGDLFPQISLEVAFAWAGTFGETEDGLAYIGESTEIPRALFNLGYRGNGITYSLIGAEIIRDILRGCPNADQAIFAFEP